MFRTIIYVVSASQVLTQYILYPEPINRKCIPYLNCPPGNAIKPCISAYQKDTCEHCEPGLEQPDWISSTPEGNTSCFKPTSLCMEEDITYRRIPETAFCQSLTGCKCDNIKCFFGDPCICNRREVECGIGEFMNQTGDCIPCPFGTEKNYTGCGPCKKLSYESIIAKQRNTSLKTIPMTTTYLTTTDNVTPFVALFKSGTSEATIEDTYDENSQIIDYTLVSIAICLGIFTVSVILLIIFTCINKTRLFIICGICFSDEKNNRDDVERNQFKRPDQLLLPRKKEDIYKRNEGKKDTGRTQTNKEICHGQSIEKKMSDRYLSPLNFEACDIIQFGVGRSENLQLSNEHFPFPDSVQITDNGDMNTIAESSSSIGRVMVEHCEEDCPCQSFLERKKINSNTLTKDISTDEENISFLSSNKRPVTTETEPHVNFIHRCPSSDSLNNMASGSYITMDVPDGNSRLLTDGIPSTTEKYTFSIESLQVDDSSEIRAVEYQRYPWNAILEHNASNGVLTSEKDSGVHVF